MSSVLNAQLHEHLQSAFSLLTFACEVSPTDINIDSASCKSINVVNGLSYHYMQLSKPVHWDIEDTGVLTYQPGEQAAIQLTYYLLENEIQLKPLKSSLHHSTSNMSMISIVFTSEYLQQLDDNTHALNASDKLLSFKQVSGIKRKIQLCNKTLQILYSLRTHNYTHRMEIIFLHAQLQMLLLYAIEDCGIDGKEEQFVCKFLANEVDKEKIYNARDILVHRIGDPITIKELSKKVAMNECYLKKGFKEIMGCTIFEFYQRQRMQYANLLLCEKGLNVTEVASILGYSSISHFSTAFKKFTGMKPCELLLK